MVTKFSETQDGAGKKGQGVKRALTGITTAAVFGAIGVGAGVYFTQDDPAAFLNDRLGSSQAPAAEVTRAGTTDFTTGVTNAADAEASAQEQAQMAELIMQAVQASAEAAATPTEAAPLDLAATAEVEPEVETQLAALQETVTTPNFVGAQASPSDQCFQDLRNLAQGAQVYFPSGGTTVDAAGMAQARLIGLVAQGCDGVIIQVEGHSDPSGDPAVNLRLSEQRAQVVVERISASGVDTSMFRAVGFGDRVPSNITGPEPAAYYDRRVEFSVVKSQQTAQTAAVAASAAIPACVVQMQTAVDKTRVFYRPNAITASQTDMAPVYQIAATAAACPEARLRVIGHFAEDDGSAETPQTGRMRAIAMMSMLVASGFDAEEIILAAPSSPTLIGPQGINNRRVDFDVIYEPN